MHLSQLRPDSEARFSEKEYFVCDLLQIWPSERLICGNHHDSRERDRRVIDEVRFRCRARLRRAVASTRGCAAPSESAPPPKLCHARRHCFFSPIPLYVGHATAGTQSALRHQLCDPAKVTVAWCSTLAGARRLGCAAHGPHTFWSTAWAPEHTPFTPGLSRHHARRMWCCGLCRGTLRPAAGVGPPQAPPEAAEGVFTPRRRRRFWRF